MKGTRSLCIAVLLGMLALLSLVGCDSDATSTFDDSRAATVQVYMAKASGGSRVIDVPQAESAQFVFERIELLTTEASGTLPTPGQITLPGGAANPNLPIPILDGPTLIELIQQGSSPEYTQVAIAEVPAGLYQYVRVQLDPAYAQLAQINLLPFNTTQLTALIPIIGGLPVEPGESITLLVDLFAREAREIAAP